MNKHSFLTAIGVICILSFFSCSKETDKIESRKFNFSNKKEDRSFIVIAKEGQDLSAIADKLTAIGAKKFKIKESLPELGLITVITPDPEFAAKARQVAGVESVVVNITMNFRLPEKVQKSFIKSGETSFVAKSAAAVTDPLSVLQWGLQSVNARQAWHKGYNGKHALVAVLDGGFFLNEPEIADRIVDVQSFVYGEDAQFQGNGFSHGTHVAGIIAAASDGYGVVGVAPKADLLLVKVLSDNGYGSFASVIDGIFYASNHEADVINMSLGGYIPTRTYIDDNGTPDDPSDDYIVEYSKDLKDLVKAMNRATVYAKTNGTLIIAAAGNDHINLAELDNYNIYPAQCTGVLAIAANGPLGWGYNQDTTLYRPAAYTNFGKNIISLGAPGGNYDDTAPFDTTLVNVYGYVAPQFVFNFVLSTGYFEDGDYYYTWAAGTSMASPYAAGVAALVYGKYNGHIAPSVVELILSESAKDFGVRGKDRFFGDGQVNAGRAVSH